MTQLLSSSSNAPAVDRQSSSNSYSSFAEQLEKGHRLKISAKTIRVLYSGIKKQALVLNISASFIDDFKSATKWCAFVVEEFEQNIGIKVDWAMVKKESHPSGPLVLALPRADWHMNVFAVFVDKVISIDYADLIVKSIKYHLTEKDRRHLPSAPRYVCHL